MLTISRIDANAKCWEKEIQQYPNQTIFQTTAWLSFVAKTQNAEPVVAVLKDGNTIVGYFTGLIMRRLGLRVLGSPFPGWTTDYMGFCLSRGIQQRFAVQALTRFAFEDLGCVHLEIAERILTLNELDGLGFDHTTRTTFEIDLTQSEDQLFANMSKSCRWCIRKAERNGVVVHQAHDLEFADEYYAQLRDVFAKQLLVPTYGVNRVYELINHLYPTGMLLLLRALDRTGRCIATGIFPAMNHSMYFWGAASWRTHQHLLPNEAIQWYAMKYWKKRGIRTYDMGGGGEYKRKYGGSEVHVPCFRKSKYPVLMGFRNLAQSAFRVRQALLGRMWSRVPRRAELSRAPAGFS